MLCALFLNATAAAATTYRITYDPVATELHVEACLAAASPELRFTAEHPRASEFLAEATRSTTGAAIAPERGALVARDWHAGECLHYSIDAKRLAAQGREGTGSRIGEALVLSPHAWLWRAAGDGAAQFAFTLPPRWSVTAPWKPAAADKVAITFVERDTPRDWPSLVAIGPFVERTIAAGDGAVRLAVLGDITEPRERVLARFAAETAADVGATFPAAFATQPQLVFVPSGRGRSAVPFGQSYRGGGTGIVLYVDPARALSDYHASWTLTHELVHVAHPYLGDDGRWLGEGIATYYQNVIRARRARIGAREAWAELHAGFGRGRAQASRLTLRETSLRMDSMRLYMRGYWSGAAIALLGDVALRTRSARPASLELALDRFARCCLGRGQRWRARAFVRALDIEVGGNAIAGLFDAHVDGSAFPNLAPAWAALGIDASGRALRFDADPAHVALRSAIMGGD